VVVPVRVLVIEVTPHLLFKGSEGSLIIGSHCGAGFLDALMRENRQWDGR